MPLALAVMACRPLMVEAIEMIPAQPPVMGTIGTGAIFPIAWYSAITEAIASIPAIVDPAVTGIEDVVEEAVHGSRLVIKCVAL